MDVSVEVIRVGKSELTNPRSWDGITTIASARAGFKADTRIDGAADFERYRKSLGTDLIYLHFYQLDKFRVERKCKISDWDKPSWAGIMHAKRSVVLARISSTKVVQSFYAHCQHKLDDWVAYQAGDIFNVRVLRAKKELAIAESVYGIANMQRHVAEFIAEFKVEAHRVRSSSDVRLFDKLP